MAMSLPAPHQFLPAAPVSLLVSLPVLGTGLGQGQHPQGWKNQA